MKKYFVSYQFADINDRFVYGFGCTELELEERIKDYSDIQDITDHIKQVIKKDEERDVNVVILYWRPFEE